jgi:uncharacterized protein (TIGR04222 family)
MLLELLQPIPGPIFLVIFIILIAVCFAIGWLLLSLDGSMKYPTPEPTYFDPLSIAALRGGKDAVLRTAIFSLWSRKLVEIKEVKTPTKGYLIKSVPSRKVYMYPIEYEIYKFTKMSKKYSEIRDDPRLTLRLYGPLGDIDRELEEHHLKRSSKHNIKTAGITIIMLSILLIIGGSKLYLGITRDKPVGCLITLLLVALIGLPIGFMLRKRQTKLGTQYLRELEDHFSWLGNRIRVNQVPEGVDPAYYIAIYGLENLFGTTFLETIRDALTIPKPVSSGGSCFSCSSCASCGGCGGCGGGGCGGCG